MLGLSFQSFNGISRFLEYIISAPRAKWRRLVIAPSKRPHNARVTHGDTDSGILPADCLRERFRVRARIEGVSPLSANAVLRDRCYCSMNPHRHAAAPITPPARQCAKLVVSHFVLTIIVLADEGSDHHGRNELTGVNSLLRVWMVCQRCLVA